jgi:phage replication-related protein YjqB (UPF0714/DUF867 family)
VSASQPRPALAGVPGTGVGPSAARTGTLKEMDASSYTGFADLERHCRRGRDFQIHIKRRPASGVAVVAPHAGRIEHGTSPIARAIAGESFNLYLLEGIRVWRNYQALHLTSHLFDEPECLALIAHCPVVLTVHGCKGKHDAVALGGLNDDLRQRLTRSFSRTGIAVVPEPHRFPATHPRNICNRGQSGKGVQLEISGSLRDCGFTTDLVAVVRAELAR